ncbi:MAG TPA: epimerase [Candidatus Marinimicrobia bacterium]|jgi:UDP-glucuronate 4-epimerase|nr:GDP-mannose 4,6-dehydratase [Candidatus Neomarinimicrobiota bacterium]MDP6230523.1 GDP-mannose 4,6-dehydratase [Candidatus Neomarinimicrobiota bacterium]MDP7094769.1 GDP-mannose 4,6-dehydratase [Candidatus Neomarinimicrobiota bacterium]MDP7165809.1 GDP-mannose 4,6-dehydratase [Candidatus Neomarinimicrobiota bacterium]MDP7512547.1 GDP-mannose 4,6-dehydratase [Candidatus Neomarinimicrobiota bacterium]|tara:strand:- start:1280 stop:2251 length:972 start_codon:yes stop_codon:yes gene_type:complete
MSAILVTGGCGFIGSHLIDKLLSQRKQVVCVDNLNDFYHPEIKLLNQKSHLDYKRYSFHKGDIRDKAFMREMFTTYSFDIVIHLAAMAGVRPSLDDPVHYTDVNINGTQVLLEEMKQKEIQHFIFASSSSVYGNNDKIPFSETDMVDRQISPYGATKKMGEELCFTYSHLYEIPTICLRFFTVYGPRQRPEMAIHKFVRHLLNDNPLPFFGDGSTARDYTYIEDIISGILAALKSTDDFMIYNLGNSEPVKLADLVSTISDVTGKAPVLDEYDLPSGDVLRTYADISRAESRLDYTPTTHFYDGIVQFVDWFRTVKTEHPQLF